MRMSTLVLTRVLGANTRISDVSQYFYLRHESVFWFYYKLVSWPVLMAHTP